MVTNSHSGSINQRKKIFMSSQKLLTQADVFFGCTNVPARLTAMPLSYKNSQGVGQVSCGGEEDGEKKERTPALKSS